MECNNRKPSARTEHFKRSVKTFVKCSEFVIYRYSYSLKCFSCRMSFSSHFLRNILFDNLGKGSSGAAVQCMNLALGLPEATGLE